MARRADKILEQVTGPSQAAAVEAVEQSLVAAAELGDTSVLPVCKTIIPQSKSQPTNIRQAAVYTVGRVGGTDRSLAGLLGRPLKDTEESATVQIECIKAFGHLKLPTSAVGKDRASATFATDPSTDWLCYWVRWKVTGKTETLEPMPDAWTATVSLTPMSH